MSLLKKEGLHNWRPPCSCGISLDSHKLIKKRLKKLKEQISLKRRMRDLSPFYLVLGSDNRLLKSSENYFIAHAPSASIVHINKKLTDIIVNKQCTVGELFKKYDSHSVQEIFIQFKELINLSIINITKVRPSKNTNILECVNPPIKTLIFHITKNCNLTCEHCYIEAQNKQYNELSKENIISAIRDFADMGGLVIDITGGEPLLRDDIYEILSSAKGSGLHTNLLSNGINFTDNIVRNLKKYVSRVTISVDGLLNSHEWIRGNGTFSNTKRGINLLKNEGIPLGVTTMLTYRNLEELEELQLFLIKKGIKYWNLVLPRLSGRFKGSKISDATCKEWFSNINKYCSKLKSIKENSKRSNMEVVIDHVMIPYKYRKEIKSDPDSLNQKLYNKGRICWDNTITILPNGDVKGCLFIDGFIYGNVRNMRLRDIYLSDKRKEVIEYFKQFKGIKECPILPMGN